MTSSYRISVERHHALKAFCLLQLALAVMLVNATPGNAHAPLYDLTGKWTSEYGLVQLRMIGVTDSGAGIVDGSFKSGPNEAKITYGRFTQKPGSGGVLKIEYFLPWRPLAGYGEFALDPKTRTLKGAYFEIKDTGPWNMKQVEGSLKLVTNLPLIKNPPSQRASKVFKVTGLWHSNFGNVFLKGTSLGEIKNVEGTFRRSDGRVGRITAGRFIRQQNGGTLSFSYFAPWNKQKGTAVFTPDRYLGGKMMVGSYKQGGDSGRWVLVRPPERTR